MRRRWGGLLRHRDFRLLWIGETVSGAGNSMANILAPLLAITALRASTFDVAALSAAGTLPWLVIGLPAGAWVDRWPVRTIMIACDLVSAVLYASLPAAAWLGVLAIWQLAAVALLAGTAAVFFATAYQVYLPSLIAADDLVEANAKLQGSASAAMIGGRGVAGAAAEAVGAATAITFNAASFLVSAACLLRIGARAPRPGSTARSTTIRAEMAAGARFIIRDPYLRPMTVYAAVGNLAYGGYASLVVVFLVRVAGLGPATVGVLMAAAGLGGVCGALFARRLGTWLGTARVQILAALSSGFGLLVPFTHAGGLVACYVIGSVVVTAAMLVQNILVAAFRQAYCPAEMLGRAVAGMRFLAFGAVPAGALAAGGLGTALGVRNALWLTLGVLALSGTLLLTPAMLAARDLPRAPAAPAEDRPTASAAGRGR